MATRRDEIHTRPRRQATTKPVEYNLTRLSRPVSTQQISSGTGQKETSKPRRSQRVAKKSIIPVAESRKPRGRKPKLQPTKAAQEAPLSSGKIITRTPQLTLRAEVMHTSVDLEQQAEEPTGHALQIKRSATLERFVKESSEEQLFQTLKDELYEYSKSLISTIDTLTSETDLQETAGRAYAIIQKIVDNTHISFEDLGIMPPRSISTGKGSQAKESKQSVNAETPPITLEDKLRSSLARAAPKSLGSEDSIAAFITAQPSSDLQQQNDSAWKDDQAKCIFGNEAIYQHTLMMKSIDRHHYEEFKKTVDYQIELKWKSPKPPSKTKKLALPAPKPDLCIGFRPHVLFGGDMDLEDALLNDKFHYMIPEERPHGNDVGRAFPFLMFQVKGMNADANSEVALLHSLNDAVHALHNIWQFMQVTEELRKEFFRTVRVFTVSMHATRLWIRVHRAVWKGEIGRIVDDYPLRFEYQNIIDLDQAPYTQARARQLLRNVMRWGIDNLLPTLQDAVRQVCERAEQERNAFP